MPQEWIEEPSRMSFPVGEGLDSIGELENWLARFATGASVRADPRNDRIAFEVAHAAALTEGEALIAARSWIADQNYVGKHALNVIESSDRFEIRNRLAGRRIVGAGYDAVQDADGTYAVVGRTGHKWGRLRRETDGWFAFGSWLSTTEAPRYGPFASPQEAFERLLVDGAIVVPVSS